MEYVASNKGGGAKLLYEGQPHLRVSGDPVGCCNDLTHALKIRQSVKHHAMDTEETVEG